jgi:hypothetical protein
MDQHSKRLAMVGALIAQSALALQLYLPTRRLSFVSDAWVYIERLRHGFWSTIGLPIGYHWQPVAYSWVAILRAALGERPALFQLVNILQLVLLAQLVYLLGRALLGARDALLASLLVVGSASFYDVVYWPLAGNMHLLAAMLWLASLGIAYVVASRRLEAWGPWLLLLTSLLATFCHPAMVTTVPVALITLWLVGRSRGESAPWILKTSAPLLVVVLAVAISRHVFRDTLALAPQPAVDAMRLYVLVSRGIIAPFTLLGSHESVHRILSLGTEAQLDSTLVRVLVPAWLFVSLAVGAVGFLRARRVEARVLIAALGIHLAALTFAGGMASRQSIVPSALAALLSLGMVRAGANSVAARWPHASVASALRGARPLTVLLLLVGAAGDHRSALDVHLRAAAASRTIVGAVRWVATGRNVYEMTFMNVPGGYYANGMGALAFANGGIVELAHAIAPQLSAVDLRLFDAPSAPEHPIPGLEYLPPDILRERVLDPQRPVILYEENPPRARLLVREDLEAEARR